MSTENRIEQTDTQSRLLNAAIELLAERELAEFTEADICARADVAMKTFARYFSSKEALFSDFIRDQIFELSGDIFNRAEERHESFSQRLKYAVDGVVESRRDYGEIERKYYRAGIQQIACDGGRILQLYGFFDDYFQRWLEQGQAHGEVTCKFDAAFMARLCTGCLLDINQNWMNDPDYPQLQRYAELKIFLPDLVAA